MTENGTESCSVGHAAEHSGHVIMDPRAVGRDPREGNDVLSHGTSIRPRHDSDQDGLVKVVEGVEGTQQRPL